MSYNNKSVAWSVRLKRKLARRITALPENVRQDLEALIADIRLTGPVRGDWPNYSKLGDGNHHCHLTYSYVAVWEVIDHQVKIVEVTYVGSRQNAPY